MNHIKWIELNWIELKIMCRYCLAQSVIVQNEMQQDLSLKLDLINSYYILHYDTVLHMYFKMAYSKKELKLHIYGLW